MSKSGERELEPTESAIKNTMNVREHPLQEATESFIEAEKTTSSTNRTVNKENWVKFDDELNEAGKGPVSSSEHGQNAIENRLTGSIPSTLVAAGPRLREPIDGKEEQSDATTSTSDHEQLSSSPRSRQMNHSQVTEYLAIFIPKFLQFHSRPQLSVLSLRLPIVYMLLFAFYLNSLYSPTSISLQIRFYHI